LSDWLGIDESVVLGVRAKPEPMDATFSRKAQGSIVQANPGAVQFASAEQLELKGRMTWIALQEREVLVSESLDLRRQRLIATPEPL
jgi:hypothetical protein